MYQSLSTLCLTHFSSNSFICLEFLDRHLPIYISYDDSPPSYINVLGSSRDLEKRWISGIAYFTNFLRSRISVLCSSRGWSKEQGLKREGLNNVGSLVDARDGLVDGNTGTGNKGSSTRHRKKWKNYEAAALMNARSEKCSWGTARVNIINLLEEWQSSSVDFTRRF